MATTNPARTVPQEELLAAPQELFLAGVMSHSGHGNLSYRLDERSFRLTAAGMIRNLTEEQLATVGMDGTLLDGALGPENAEIVAMHTVVYRLRPDVGSVIHTHSPSATAFAMANRPLPCRSEPLLRFGQAEPVPVAAWAPRGSEESVKDIERVLSESPTTSALLLGNHGLLAFGGTPMAAARLVIAIEEAASGELAAAALGGATDFPEGALQAVRASMARVRS